jgi:hypothetical protein
MRILIIGTARSGTTTLTTAIGSVMSLNQIMEPFNPGVPYNLYNPIQKNIILKTLIQHHETFDDLVELSKTFDKTILLSRRDKIASWESYCNGVDRRQKLKERNGYYDGFHLWHQPYVHNPESLDEKSKDVVIGIMDSIVDLSEYMGLPIVWYEDLYSTNKDLAEKTFNDLGLDIKYDDVYTYMNPTKKYRKDSNTLI